MTCELCYRQFRVGSNPAKEFPGCSHVFCCGCVLELLHLSQAKSGGRSQWAVRCPLGTNSILADRFTGLRNFRNYEVPCNVVKVISVRQAASSIPPRSNFAAFGGSQKIFAAPVVKEKTPIVFSTPGTTFIDYYPPRGTSRPPPFIPIKEPPRTSSLLTAADSSEALPETSKPTRLAAVIELPVGGGAPSFASGTGLSLRDFEYANLHPEPRKPDRAAQFLGTFFSKPSGQKTIFDSFDDRLFEKKMRDLSAAKKVEDGRFPVPRMTEPCESSAKTQNEYDRFAAPRVDPKPSESNSKIQKLAESRAEKIGGTSRVPRSASENINRSVFAKRLQLL